PQRSRRSAISRHAPEQLARSACPGCTAGPILDRTLRLGTRNMNKIVATPSSDSTVKIPESSPERITVLSPVGFPPKINKKASAPRPESLDGKTVYLVDCRFDDSIELLKQVQSWFAEHMPAVK